jgi:hypothetical protein
MKRITLGLFVAGSLALAACGGSAKAAVGSSGGGTGSAGGSSGSSASSDSTAAAAPATSGSPSVAAFCSDAGKILTDIETVNQTQEENDGTSAAPSTADWQKAEAEANTLLGQSPDVILNHGNSSQTPQAMVQQLVTDLDDIVSNGYDHSNDFAQGIGAGSDFDLSNVQADADWCPGGAQAVADAQGRGTNGSPSEPLAPATADSGVNGNLNTVGGSPASGSTSTTAVTDSNGDQIIQGGN